MCALPVFGAPWYTHADPRPASVTVNKRERQHAILELMATREIGSQEELRQL